MELTNVEKDLKVEDAQVVKKEIPELIPLAKFNKYLDYPKVSTLRQLRFYGHKNGFDKVVRYIGATIYISMPDFYEWVNTNNGKKACC